MGETKSGIPAPVPCPEIHASIPPPPPIPRPRDLVSHLHGASRAPKHFMSYLEIPRNAPTRWDDSFV